MPGSWIQADVNLVEHPKTYALADRLGITNAHAVGLMVCLWGWAYRSAPDGLLTHFPARAIAAAAGWHKTSPKAAAAFVDALTECRWLDHTEEGQLHIHDWDEHEGLVKDYMEQRREKDRQRVKRYREKKSKKQPEKTGDEEETCNATVTLQKDDRHVTVTEMSRCIPIPVPIPDQYHNAAYDNQVPGSSDTAHVDGLRCVCEEFEQKIRLPKPEEREILKQLVEEYGDDLVRSAIVEAEGKGRSANYVASILERWRKQGQPVSGKDKPSQGASYDLKEYEKATMEVPPFVLQEADG